MQFTLVASILAFGATLATAQSSGACTTTLSCADVMTPHHHHHHDASHTPGVRTVYATPATATTTITMSSCGGCTAVAIPSPEVCKAEFISAMGTNTQSSWTHDIPTTTVTVSGIDPHTQETHICLPTTAV